jgi:hypothetical protein
MSWYYWVFQRKSYQNTGIRGAGTRTFYPYFNFGKADEITTVFI